MQLIDISANVDFFSGVYFDGDGVALAHPNYFPLWVERPKGMLGYNRAWGDETTGFIKAVNTERPDMGMFITGGGQALERLCEQTGESTRLKAAVRSGLDYARVSRLDLYIDIYDEGQAAHDFYLAVFQDKIKTTARTVRFYHGSKKEQGVTTYLGSQGGLRMIRLYNKDAESKGAIKATRVEIQTRHAYARQLWELLCKNPSYLNLLRVTCDAIRGILPVSGVDAIEDALEGALPDVVPSRIEKDADFWAWIKRQVMPSFWRNYNETQTDEYLRQFTEIYMQMTGRANDGKYPVVEP